MERTPPHPSARARFEALAAGPDDGLDLAEAALLISAEAQPSLDVEHWLRRLDGLAAEVRPRVAAASDGRGRLEALSRFLFESYGLAGNTRDYYDPRNSYLDQVLERRTGIPITLSVVLMEVGRRVGLSLDGVGFPAHFLVRYRGERDIYVDPFHRGRFLSTRDCAALLDSLSSGSLPFEERYLQPVSKRGLLVRMLRNLKALHSQRGELLQAIAAIDRMLLLDPDQPTELRDRGMLLYDAHHYRGSVNDLSRYLAEYPEASDGALARSRLAQAREKLLLLN